MRNRVKILKIFSQGVKLNIAVVFILLSPLYLSAQMNSTESRIRQIQEFMRSRNNANSQRTAQSRQSSGPTVTPRPNAGTKNFSARITLVNGSVLAGKIVLENRSIKVSQVRAGVRFTKELTLTDIKEISIEKYEAYPFRNYKGFIAYYFLPIIFKIKDRSGTVYFYTNKLNWLNRIIMVNEMGRAILTTVYVDYWMTKEKRWYKSRSQDRDYPENNQPGEICRKIVLENNER